MWVVVQGDSSGYSFLKLRLEIQIFAGKEKKCAMVESESKKEMSYAGMPG